MKREDLMSRLEKIKTGLVGLDNILQNVRQGESVVWQISDNEDYEYFAGHFAAQGIKEGHNVIYFRFSDYSPILEPQEGLDVINVDLNAGFEKLRSAYTACWKSRTPVLIISSTACRNFRQCGPRIL